MGFEEHLEPIRPEFEIKAKKKGEERVNPVTGVFMNYVKLLLQLINIFLDKRTICFNSNPSAFLFSRSLCCFIYGTQKFSFIQLASLYF